jgi:hypothetical protein
MKKVLSPVKALLRAIGRLLRAIGRLLRRLARLLRRPGRLLRRLGPLLRQLGRPVAKLAKLRGKPLIAVLVVLAVVVVVAVLSLKPGPDDNKQVRETLDKYAKATREKDYQTLCDSLYATDLVERIRSAGLPCEVALRTGLQDRQNPRLEVRAVEVNGDQALAKARASATGEVPAVVTIRLVREGDDWRVASLVEPGSANPSVP